MLQNDYLVTKIGVDTAENEALRVRVRDAVDRRLPELRHREVEQDLLLTFDVFWPTK